MPDPEAAAPTERDTAIRVMIDAFEDQGITYLLSSKIESVVDAALAAGVLVLPSAVAVRKLAEAFRGAIGSVPAGDERDRLVSLYAEAIVPDGVDD